MVDANGFMSVGVELGCHRRDLGPGERPGRRCMRLGKLRRRSSRSTLPTRACSRSRWASDAGSGCTFSATPRTRPGTSLRAPAPTSFAMALAQEANGNATWGGTWHVATDEHMSQGKSRYSSSPGADVSYRLPRDGRRPDRDHVADPRPRSRLDRRQAGRDRRRVLADDRLPPARLHGAPRRGRAHADDPGAGHAQRDVEGRARRYRRLPGAGAGRAVRRATRSRVPRRGRRPAG